MTPRVCSRRRVIRPSAWVASVITGGDCAVNAPPMNARRFYDGRDRRARLVSGIDEARGESPGAATSSFASPTRRLGRMSTRPSGSSTGSMKK